METTKVVVFKFKEILEKKFGQKISYKVKPSMIPEFDVIEFYTYGELQYGFNDEGDKLVVASATGEKFTSKAGNLCHWIIPGSVTYHINIIPTNTKFAIPYDDGDSDYDEGEEIDVFAKIQNLYSSVAPAKERVLCECGQEVARGSLKSHQKTKKHTDRLAATKVA